MRALSYFTLLGATILARNTEAMPSAGCCGQNTVKVDQTVNITLGNRWYLLYFPVKYQSTTPAPLVLSYHGGNRDAVQQQQLDLLSTTYFNQDHVVVYPNGINETWQGVPGVTTDDVGFTSSILDQLEAQYCIDTDRIFATGKSQGGGFVGVLACDQAMSTRIASFSPVSGAFYVSNTGNTCDPETVAIVPCSPGRTDVPMLEFHGLADATIRYNGGPRRGDCLPSIPHWVQTWAERDDLGSRNVTSPVPGAEAGSTAVRYEFGNGTSLGLVTHIMDGDNIGHDWPSTQHNADQADSGSPPATFNATSLILNFFAAHPLESNGVSC